MPIYKVYKNLGETPLECLNRIRSEKVIGLDVPMTFAGRLDPAAEGEMHIITGDDIKEKDKYLAKDKIYEVEYVFGLKTDTGDLLGLVQEYSNVSFDSISEDILIGVLKNLSGARSQAFHKFSSKVVDGKALWQHQRDGTVASAQHPVNIHRLELLSVSRVSSHDIFGRVTKICGLVGGDFRQDKILESFEFLNKENTVFPIVKIYANVSSGTYMRVLGEEIGEILGIPVVAYSIVRKEVIL